MQVSWIDAERIKQLVAQIACDDNASPALPSVDTGGFIEEAAVLSGPDTGWLESVDPVVRPDLEVPPDSFCAQIQDVTDLVKDAEVDGSASLPCAEAALPLSRIRDKLRAIRQRAADAGILSRQDEPSTRSTALTSFTPSAVSETLGLASTHGSVGVHPHATFDFQVPQGPREQRLAAFGAWAGRVLAGSGSHVLVMSEEGDVLWGGEAKAGLVLSAMMAWGAAMHGSALPPTGTHEIARAPLGSGQVLTVVPCQTITGTLHAAVVAPQAVPEATASLLRNALAAAIS